MDYREISPNPPLLKKHIRCFYLYEEEVINNIPVQTSYPSDGGPEVILVKDYVDFGYNDNLLQSYKGPLLIGPSSGSLTSSISQKLTFFGIRFNTGSINNFTESKLTNLTDTILPTSEIWKDDLNDLIFSTNDFNIMVQRATSFLLGRFYKNSNHMIERAIQLINNYKGQTDIESLSYKLNISRRHLERLFLEETGLTPKKYARITRFQSLIGSIADYQETNWIKTAHSFGYSDQSHMIRDFKYFTKQKPGEWLAQNSNLNNVIYR